MSIKVKKTRPPRIDPKFSRSKNKEGIVIQNLINNFQPRGSRGEKLIEQITQNQIKNISKAYLVNLTRVLNKLINEDTELHIERKYHRNTTLTIKWFDDNYDEIMLFVPYVQCETY